jgi:4-hydroxy-tetrahydrodipicolinate synthase
LYGKLYHAALTENWEECQEWQELTDSIAVVYQKGRTLGESLAALKVLMNFKGICNATMMPPLTELPETEVSLIKNQYSEIVRKTGC